MSDDQRRAEAILDDLVGRWRRRLLTAAAVIAASLALALAIVAARAGAGAAAIAALAATAVLVPLLGAARRGRRIDRGAITDHLDRVRPDLEDSAGLLLTADARLAPLARLQRRRVAHRLIAQDDRDLLSWRPLQRALVASTVALASALLVVITGPPPTAPTAPPAPAIATPIANGAVSVRSLSIAITPPAYSGRELRHTPGPGLRALEGSELTWSVTLDGEVDRLVVALGSGAELELAASPDGLYSASLQLDRSRLYHLRGERAGGVVCETASARLEALADAPPRVDIARPQALVELDAVTALGFEAVVEDDHGVTSAALIATVASGGGEQVAFRERRLPIARRDRAPGRVDLSTELDLAELGLAPGSELYLHVEASDNRTPEPNRARSPTHVVRIRGDRPPVTAVATGLPVLQLPPFFRSQRQIILDTEALLAARPELTEAELARRARRIAFDQRALRRRYGTLLGDEFESGSPLEADDEEGEGDDHEHGDEPEAAADDEADPNDPLAALPEGLRHQHDAAESFTFFATSVRAELKRALGAMWQAEGELHTAALELALPHEHRALRHLIEVRERSRVYVAKVGFAATPFDVAAVRLSGELDDVRGRSIISADAREEDDAPFRLALDAIARLRRDGALPPDAGEVLAAAADAATVAATEDAAVDLVAVDRLRALSEAASAVADDVDLDRVRATLWRLLAEPSPRPAPPPQPGGALLDDYRARLGAAR